MWLCFAAALTPEESGFMRDVDLALARAGISHKEAAITMGLDPSLWTRQRAGQGHISLRRLARLPAAFHRELVALRAARVGMMALPESQLTAALLAVVSFADKRMARMTAPRKEQAHDAA